MKTALIMLATVTCIVLALATLGDATQIGLFLFVLLCPRWPRHRQLMSSSRQTRLERHLWPKLLLNRQTVK